MALPFIVVTSDQRTEAWKAARLGRLTGSCVAAIFAQGRKKGEESIQRRDLRLRLALEQLTEESCEDVYVTRDMQRGAELEGPALAHYEAVSGILTRRVGFLAHPTLMAGCSPDGEIAGFKGLVELKCPKSATHLSYLKSQDVPEDYLHQCRHNMWMTGAEFCDFVSFDPRFPSALRFVRKRVTMTEAERLSHQLAVQFFLNEVSHEVDALRAMGKAAA